MVDAGWSPSEIAAHYQADRDWRAGVERIRRKGIVPTVEAIKEYQRTRSSPLSPLSLTAGMRF
jgi:hypothetical protein